MAGLPFDAKTFKELWNTWTIRGLIILSLLLQSFLILFAPLRRPIGDKWFFRFPLWIAYLLADWIAIFVIGLILHAERSHDILVFWAPFLLLHLGGPDTITSFSLEDNEFWIRHLLQLILQVGSTVYAIIQSLPHNKLLLPTLLVLTAGIIKYAERNCAFYLACSDHYGEARFSFFKKFDNGVNSNKTLQLLKELTPYGTLRNLLLGPLITPQRRDFFRKIFLEEESAEESAEASAEDSALLKRPKEQAALKTLKDPEGVRWMIEFELSLLYEILHTKFPVIKCKIGSICRIICMGCISGALLSFILITKAKQYRDELENSEVWITYGLLIGAITLDFISIGLLISSDYFITDCKSLRAFENENTKMDFIYALIGARVRNRNLWSKRIPQLNILTYFVKACPDWLNKLHKFPPIRFVLEFIQGFRSMSSQDFKDEVWHCIFTQVKERANDADTVEKGKQSCLKRGDRILNSLVNENLSQSLKNLDDVKTILTWHIATGLCSLHCEFGPCTLASANPSTSASANSDYRVKSELLSDYAFYLLREETVIGSKIDRRMVFDNTYKDIQSVCIDKNRRSVYQILSTETVPEPGSQRNVLRLARELFNELKGPNKSSDWKLISEVWVELICYVAINCRPNLHAQQPSKGGQLLTIVWLLMNHFGLGTQFETDRDASS